MLPIYKETNCISRISPVPSEPPQDLATRIMQWYLSHDGLLIQSFNVEAKENIILAKIAVENNPLALEFVSESLKDNEGLVKFAILKNGMAFFHASARLKKQEDIFNTAFHQILENFPELFLEFGLKIIDQCPDYIERFFPLLANCQPFVQKAVIEFPLYLCKASPKLKKDQSLFDLAFELTSPLGNRYVGDLLRNLACYDLFFLHFLPTEFKKDNPGLIKACFDEYLENHFEYDQEFLNYLGSDPLLLEIVCSFLPDLFEHANDKLKGDKDYIMHMITSSHSRIFEFTTIELQADPEVALLACTEEGGNLFYAKGACFDSLEIVNAACENEPLAYFFASGNVQKNSALAAFVLNKMQQDFFKLLPAALFNDSNFWKGIVSVDESLIPFVPKTIAF